jgi:serine acetyltransferase
VSIGANAVVLSSVPSNSIAVGIPARVLPRKPHLAVASTEVLAGEMIRPRDMHAHY